MTNDPAPTQPCECCEAGAVPPDEVERRIQAMHDSVVRGEMVAITLPDGRGAYFPPTDPPAGVIFVLLDTEDGVIVTASEAGAEKLRAHLAALWPEVELDAVYCEDEGDWLFSFGVVPDSDDEMRAIFDRTVGR